MPEKLAVSFVPVQPANIAQLKALNLGLFPIKYQDRVYSDILASGSTSQLGSTLVAQALQEAEQDGNIKEAYLHVQSNNHEAMEFYAKCGFAVGETVRNYYPRLNPRDAVTLRRVLSPVPNVVAGLPVIHD